MPRTQFQNLAEQSFPERKALWYYRMANVVWLWIGFAIALSFVQWRIDPNLPSSALDSQVHDQVVLWIYHLAGLAAGCVLFAGVWLYLPRLEIMGHCLLTGYIVANAVAVLSLPPGTGSRPLAFVITVSIAFASAFRVLYLIKFTPIFHR